MPTLRGMDAIPSAIGIANRHHQLLAKRLRAPIPHVGPIHSGVAGRTDHLPMSVESGSYVLPAHVVSHLGLSNTTAGFKVLRRVFGGTPYAGGDMPYNAHGGPYGEPLARRDGGESNGSGTVPIVAAGGEMVLSPTQVRSVGAGDLDLGHRVLDEFVKHMTVEAAKTIAKLPPPARN